MEVFNGDKDPEEINNTCIALIQKCKNSTNLKNFQPISLGNVIIKMVTNTIANILKHILPDVIDTEQSAFVNGRFITDNTLIAMECFHWMKNKKEKKDKSHGA